MTSAVVTLAGLDGAGGVTRVADAVADAKFPVDMVGVASGTTRAADAAKFPVDMVGVAGGTTRAADAVADAEFPVDTAGVAGRTTGVADVVAEFPGRQLPTGPVDAALFLATGQCCYKNMK